jgi:hypothetical protein
MAERRHLMGEYPSEAFLKWIKSYDVLKDGPCDLIRAIKAEWQYSDYIRWYPKTKTLKISTGGWSGHEEILQALCENFVFWGFWVASLRGGHFTFRLHDIEGCAWSVNQ